MVAKRVSDGSILRLIKSWLRAPVEEEDTDEYQERYYPIAAAHRRAG